MEQTYSLITRGYLTPTKALKITPAKQGSGKTDVSIHHAYKGQNVDQLRQRVNDFHDAVDGVLGVNEEMLRCYARLRARLESSGQTIGANETWIAAQALAEQAVLVTNNTREFTRVPDLLLENWLQE